MSVGIKNAERIRLTGEKRNIHFLDAAGKPYTYLMTVDRFLGEGSTCICYDVTVHKTPDDPGQKRVLKQFYPLPMKNELDITMDGLELNISGYTDDPETTHHKEITRLGAGFEEAFRRQASLAKKDNIYDIIARPDLCYFNGATKYVLYEADYGNTLDLNKITTIEEFLHTMYKLACALEKLHSYGLIYMDLKPENILISGNGSVKLIDLDAVIDIKDLQNVHLSKGDIRFDMTDPSLIAPEIRPEMLGEFEQNKYFLLTNRVDIYSFGAIMLKWFLGRYPTENDCTAREFEQEILAMFRTGKLRGKLTQDEQTSLIEILWRCIQENTSPDGRYLETGELVKNLDSLQKLVSVSVSMRRQKYDRVRGRVQAAYVMDRFPLCDYCVRTGENEWVMDALIIGDDPISEDFFSNTLACAQMLDTKLVIRIAAGAAKELLKDYLNRWPLFSRTCILYLEDQLYGSGDGKDCGGIDQEITSVPFAEVRFYEWDQQKDPVGFISGMEKHDQISWVLAVDEEIGKNYTLAGKIADFLQSEDKRRFVGYLDERGDGFELRKPRRARKGVTLSPFNANKAWSMEEKQFKEGINRKAFLLHKFYTREWNERASKTELWNTFKEAYNVNSSLCSVLSIPYKLGSLGITDKKEKAARAYWNMVLSPDKEDARKNVGRMICLEHRRWMSFMMTEGYDFSGDRYKNYAFSGANDQRNKVDKLHICICDCSEKGIMLDHFSHELWDAPDFKNIASKKGIELDSLDTMSVRFHQFCSRKISSMVEKGVFEIYFSRLEQVLSNEKVLGEEPVPELMSSLRNIHARMLDNESDINTVWGKTCRLFKDTIKSLQKPSNSSKENALRAFDDLENLTRIVVERNSYHDYKSSDRTILEVIPLLIISDNPIRRIHKPAAGHTWQNIISSIMIEPEQIYLYTDRPEELDLKKIRTFLMEERGLSYGKEDLQIRSMQELYHLKITDTSLRSVLDITGLSGEEIYRLAKRANLRELPFISFKDGTIRCMDENTEIDYYSVLRRHLTVRENFFLHNAYIHSEEKQNYMLGLTENYDKIWESYIKISPFNYKILVNILSQIEGKKYWKINREQQGEIEPFSINTISYRMVRDTGIDKILLSLRENDLIENRFVYPKTGEIGHLTVKSRYPDVIKAVKKMLLRALSNPYMHRFEFVKTRRDPFTDIISEKDLYYIYDDTRVVDINMKEEEINDGEGRKRKTSEIVGDALNILMGYSTKGGDGLIIDRYGMDPVTTDPAKPGEYRVRFIYKNRSTKECLIKEGNALEAFVYHSLWKSAFVDDIKLNVAFTWGTSNEQEALDPAAIKNETDLVCASNMQTFFISCKQAMPTTAHLQEIKFFGDYFGVEGKAVLVTSNWRTRNPEEDVVAQMVAKRAEMMDVYYIDRSMMGKYLSDMKNNHLVAFFQRIFNGEKDWKNIKQE